MDPNSIRSRIFKNYDLAVSALSQNSAHQSPHWEPYYRGFKQKLEQLSWDEFRINGLTDGLDSSFNEPFDKAFIKQKYELLSETMGPYRFLLEESNIGCPKSTIIDKHLVSVSSLNNGYLAFRLISEMGIDSNQELKILEIGGGYGGLCFALKRFFKNGRFWLLDLPPANALSAYFLYSHFKNSQLSLLEEFKANSPNTGLADFTILPGWLITEMRDKSVDIVINTCSFMEMNFSVIQSYFEQIQRVLKPGGYFYCVNRYSKKVGDQFICIGSYPFDSHWDLIYSQPKWDTPHIHELITRRTKKASPAIRNCLDQLSKIGKTITVSRNTDINIIQMDPNSTPPYILPKTILFPGPTDFVLIFSAKEKKLQARPVSYTYYDEQMIQVNTGLLPLDTVLVPSAE